MNFFNKVVSSSSHIQIHSQETSSVDSACCHFGHRLSSSRAPGIQHASDCFGKWHTSSAVALIKKYVCLLRFVAKGPLIMSSHVAVMGLWFTLAVVNTVTVHSGYHFPGLVSPESHDFHHQKFTECYGVLGILDYLHGTDRLFRASPAYKRHFVNMSLEPVRSLIPDEPKSTTAN